MDRSEVSRDGDVANASHHHANASHHHAKEYVAMTALPDTTRLPIFARPEPGNSVWYGSLLVNLLATAEMTGNRYSLQIARGSKGFAPPAPHRHGPEDFYILQGQVRFWVAQEEILASAGDYVRTLPGVWHTLQIESDEAEILQIFSPPGLEQLFQEMGRPAEAMELPAGRVGPPDADRLRAFGLTHGIEFAPPGTTPQDMHTLP
jgi:mannose-6-phosphate isomerase-like protein (cupin superfamily)